VDAKGGDAVLLAAEMFQEVEKGLFKTSRYEAGYEALMLRGASN
jgi:hypothetical protein